jgi:CHAD domain-containing protein
VEEVRRVALGRVDSAVSSLRQIPGGDQADAIHTARKDMKKLRAVLTLVRGELGKKTYRRENERFGGAAKKLSESRDAEVLIATLASVLEDYPQDAPPVDRLVADLEARRHSVSAEGADERLEAIINEVADEIEQGGSRIADWPLRHSDWSLFEDGLKRSYRGGRKALAAIERHSAEDGLPEPGDAHTFRKRVKELWYALRLFQDTWPDGLKGPTEAADGLADTLGRYNDLSVLLDEIESRGGADQDPQDPGGEDLSVLTTAIRDRQAGMLEQILPVARRLYAEEPEAFTARIGAYWAA